MSVPYFAILSSRAKRKARHPKRLRVRQVLQHQSNVGLKLPSDCAACLESKRVSSKFAASEECEELGLKAKRSNRCGLSSLP
eukprot:2281458-Pleurochrysis_carterae.AAC.2